MVEKIRDSGWATVGLFLVALLVAGADLLGQQFAGSSPTQASLVSLHGQIATLQIQISNLEQTDTNLTQKLSTMPGPNEFGDLERRVGALEADQAQVHTLETEMAVVQEEMTRLQTSNAIVKGNAH